MLSRPEAGFALAEALRGGRAALGDVFSFLSGLYFRGKLAYALQFGATPPHIITAADGLQPPARLVGLDDLRRWSATAVDLRNPDYLAALTRDTQRLAAVRPPDATVILLGSLATPKYLGALLPILGEALLVPREMIGRGDMSRGAMLLRAARQARELEYIPAREVARRRPSRA